MTTSPTLPTEPSPIVGQLVRALLDAPTAIVCSTKLTKPWSHWSPCPPGMGHWRGCVVDLVDVRTPRGDALERRRVLRGVSLIEALRPDGSHGYLGNAEWWPTEEWTLRGEGHHDHEELVRVADSLARAAWKLWLR